MCVRMSDKRREYTIAFCNKFNKVILCCRFDFLKLDRCITDILRSKIYKWIFYLQNHVNVLCIFLNEKYLAYEL